MKSSIIFIASWLAILVVQQSQVVDGRPFNFTQTIQNYWASIIRPMMVTPDYSFAYNQDALTKSSKISGVKGTIDGHCRYRIIPGEARCLDKAFVLYAHLNAVYGPLDTGRIRTTCCLVSFWYDCTRDLVLKKCGPVHEKKFINDYYFSNLFEEYVLKTDCSEPDDCRLIPGWRLIIAGLITGFLGGMVFMVIAFIVRWLIICINGCRSHRYNDDNEEAVEAEEEAEVEQVPMRQFSVRVSHL